MSTQPELLTSHTLSIRSHGEIRYPVTDLSGPLRTLLLAVHPERIAVLIRQLAEDAEIYVGDVRLKRCGCQTMVTDELEEVSVGTEALIELLTYLNACWSDERDEPILQGGNVERSFTARPSWVRAALTGRRPLALGPNHVTALDSVFDIWRYDEGGRRQQVRIEFIGLLLDDDPSIRAAAAVFFRSFSFADDEGALMHAFVEHLELFDGVPNPWNQGGADLRGLIAAALAGRYRRLNEAARAIVRRESHRPDCGQWVAAGLSMGDPKFVMSKAASIAFASPDAVMHIVVNLARLRLDVSEVVASLKSVVSDDVIRSAMAAVEVEWPSGVGA